MSSRERELRGEPVEPEEPSFVPEFLRAGFAHNRHSEGSPLDPDGNSVEINACNYPDRWAALEHMQKASHFGKIVLVA